jgi:hypothetical protein
MNEWKKLRIATEVTSGPKPVLQLPPDHVIGSTRQMQFLARLLIYIDVPRREVPEWVTNTFYAFEGFVIDEHGRDVTIDVDEFYASFNEDAEFRWISDFLKFAQREPRQRAQRRVMDRLRYLTAAAAVYEYTYRHDIAMGIHCLNPARRFDQAFDWDLLPGKWNPTGLEFVFCRLHKYRDYRDQFAHDDGLVDDPRLLKRSFTSRAIVRRFARWWLTHLFWFLPKSVILKMIF